MRKTVLLMVAVCSLAGCAPVLVGGLILHSSKSKGQKQEFMRELQRTNMERESRGLRPLDWCSEAYRFDRGWAMEDPECARRILAYEAGDLTALGSSEFSVPDTTSHSVEPRKTGWQDEW